jgi:hypothetical protein
VTVEDRLRRVLGARASGVEPSDDGWARIQSKTASATAPPRRRPAPRVLVLAAMASITVIALAVALLSQARSGPSERLAVASGQPTTIATLAAVTTAPASGYAGIFPDTAVGLAQDQAAYDGGAQPWRGDPVAVASAYLASIGVSNPQPGLPVAAGPLATMVSYQAPGYVAGTVTLDRLKAGGIYFVTGLWSSAAGAHIGRFVSGIRVDVTSAAAGTVSLSTRSPGGSYGPATTAPIAGGGTAALGTGVRGGTVVVRVRVDGADGLTAITETLVP